MIMTMAGSNSVSSINQEVAKYIASKLDCFYYDTRRIDIPVFNRDNEPCSEIRNLYNLVQEYNYLILVIPEFNGNIASFFKNIIDEISVVDREFLHEKSIFVVCTTPGNSGGVALRKILTNTIPYFKGNIVGDYGVCNYENLEGSVERLDEIVQEIQKFIR